MFVGMWMTKDVVTIEPATTVEVAVRLMAERRIRRLPVLAATNFDSPLVGIVSATDVLRAPPALAVKDIMTADPVTIEAEAPIELAAAILRERKIGALPVVRHERLIGLITESDVFGAFTQIFDLSSTGARITFDIAAREDVLPFIAATAQKHALRITSFVSLHTNERPMCVVHVAGAAIDAMLEDVWKSHHRVASVLRGSE